MCFGSSTIRRAGSSGRQLGGSKTWSSGRRTTYPMSDLLLEAAASRPRSSSLSASVSGRLIALPYGSPWISTLRALRARDRGCEAEPDEHASRDVALAPQQPLAPPQPLSGRAGEEGVRAVAERGE